MAKKSKDTKHKDKNPVGRPRKYKSPEEMQKAIDAYFEDTIKLTVTGLALHLGFTSRADLIRYEGYSQEFYYAIKRAKLRIEAYYEKHLTGPNVAGSIFALKNFGWKDKTEVVQERTEGEKVEIGGMKGRLEALESAGDGIPTD